MEVFMALMKNQKVSHVLYPHAAKAVDGKYYCRALNEVVDSKVSYCKDCPLYGGKSIDENNEFCTQCAYYDLEVGFSDYMTPDNMKRRVDALILAGLTSHFPEYLPSEDKAAKFELIEKAIVFAGNAHFGAYRKGTKLPYIVHPMEAMMITAHLTNDVEVIAAAALHDVVEDTEFGYDDIERNFGKRVADLVAAESENKRPEMDKTASWRIRKEESIAKAKDEPIEAKMIMLADKLSNMRASYADYKVCGDCMWEKFNMRDPLQQKWYYKSVLEVLNVLEDTEAYKELQMLYTEIFCG